MGKEYRNWDERKSIIRAIIADRSDKSLESFELSESELVYFRSRSEKYVDKLARSTSGFTSYYSLPAKNPFLAVLYPATLIAIVSLALIVYLHFRGVGFERFSIYAALISSTILSIGWVINGYLSHRNSVKQYTNNMLFARFSQAPFSDYLHRFHKKFGNDLSPYVGTEDVKKLKSSDCDDDIKAGSSVAFILNYFELICCGVVNGDLDKNVVKNNIRGMICFYHDKCFSYIYDANRRNPKTFENIIKVRTHYREP